MGGNQLDFLNFIILSRFSNILNTENLLFLKMCDNALKKCMLHYEMVHISHFEL